MIVEYTGNKFPPGQGSGEVKDANLGYGMSGGQGFIWVTMPYIEVGRKSNGLADDEIAILWKGMLTHDHFDGQKQWGYPACDRASAVVRLTRLKGRPVLVCGQHASTVRDEYLKDHMELARFRFLDVPTDQIFKIPEGPYIHSHTDLWMHRESEYRQQARAWLQDVLAEKRR